MKEALITCSRPDATTVLGIPVSTMPLGDLLDLAFGRIAAGERTLFTTANAHSIVIAQGLPEFAAHFRDADVVLPDGISTALSVFAFTGSTSGRISGPDFFEAFLARAASAGVSIFLLGTTDETLQRLSNLSRARWPSLVIAGTLAPPFGDWDEETDRRLIAEVNRSGADALFVAMTAPKQELWLSRNLGGLEPRFAMGVGAAFDFAAGIKPRAPRLLGQLGLEWLFRLALEPRRLWRRNMNSALYVWMLAHDVLRRGRDRERGPSPQP